MVGTRTDQILGLSLFLVPQVLVRLLPLHGAARDIVAIIALAVSLPAAVFAGTGHVRRKLRGEAEEARRYPNGRDERARREAWQRVSHIRARLAYTCAVAVLVVAAVAWFIVLAVARHDGKFVAGAIVLAPLALLFGAVTAMGFRGQRRYRDNQTEDPDPQAG